MDNEIMNNNLRINEFERKRNIDWKLNDTWIRDPANRNNNDLNNACTIIWYNIDE